MLGWLVPHASAAAAAAAAQSGAIDSDRPTDRRVAVAFERSHRKHAHTMDRNQQQDKQFTATQLTGPLYAHDKPAHYYATQNSCNVKMIGRPTDNNTRNRNYQDQRDQNDDNSLLASIQRKLFTLLYVYAIIIISLYLTYAIYYFIQQQRQTAISGNKKHTAAELRAGSELFGRKQFSSELNSNALLNAEQPNKQMDTKLHLLERYIELIAIDLQETKDKLKEREKCDCSQSCHFNGTRYDDRSSWQNQCDICTCQMGKISCQPKRCPPIKCDDDHLVTLPGQCCPTCMRQCKYNKMLIRHGEKFNPKSVQPRNDTTTKVCQCLDGRIKCELVAASNKATGSNGQLHSQSTNGDNKSSNLSRKALATTTIPIQQATEASRLELRESNNRRAAKLAPSTSGLPLN